jgi:hypothetical protein
MTAPSRRGPFFVAAFWAVVVFLAGSLLPVWGDGATLWTAAYEAARDLKDGKRATRLVAANRGSAMAAGALVLTAFVVGLWMSRPTKRQANPTATLPEIRADEGRFTSPPAR